MSVSHLFDETDRAVLNEIQKRIPLDHRPFAVIGEKVGISEQECLGRIARLREQKVIRELCTVFDAQALGYQTSLVAMKLDPMRCDDAAELIGQHPGTSYLARYDDPFNLWLAIAVPSGDTIEQTIHVLHTLARAEETILLPVLRRYTAAGKINPAIDDVPWQGQQELRREHRRVLSRPSLTEQDLQYIRAVQEELPLLEIPYAVWAEQVETTEQELFGWMKRMEHLGYLLNIAATLQRSALTTKTAEVVIAWDVPQENVDSIGQRMAAVREVSYCQRHPTYAHWPSSLLTVIHAETEAVCQQVIRRMEERLGRFPHKHLKETQRYRKRRARYFSPMLEAWRKLIGNRVELAK